MTVLSLQERLLPQTIGPFAGVVFDMDGVLLDTEPMYKKAMIQACADLGYEMDAELHNAQIGVPADATEHMLRMAFGDDFPLGKYKDMSSRIMQGLTAQGVPIKPGVRELLFELKTRGIPAAVATSTARPIAPDRLAHAGIADMFTAVITRNEVANGKPHPEPFLTAAKGIGIAPDRCIALEDSHNGIRAAHAAGMMAIMVPDLLEPTPEIMELCHAVMDSLHDVRAAAFGAGLSQGARA